MAENYGVYEDQRKKFLDSYMQKDGGLTGAISNPVAEDITPQHSGALEDITPENQSAIPNPTQTPETVAFGNQNNSVSGINPTDNYSAIPNPTAAVPQTDSDSMKDFTPREEIGGTYGARIGENGIANPMNTLEDVNKNVASFETPKDFTTEVIKGNQRSLYGYDKGGMAVPTVKNPWERENQEARASEIYNRAINNPDFDKAITGYANAIKPGINQDVAELKNQFAIDKMNNDWNKKFDLEQMKNNFRWSLKDHFGNKSDSDKQIKEEKKSLGASYGELRKTVDYILNPANGATEEERSRANQLKKKLPEYYTKDLNEVGSGRPALNIDYANSYVQGVGGGESSTSPIYANPPTPRAIKRPPRSSQSNSGLLDNTFNIPDIKNPIPNHIYRNKKNGRDMFYDGDNWRYSDSNSSTGWSWATRR